MKEEQIKKLGFKLVKEYNHDQFHTKRYEKGILRVEFTYEGKHLELVDLEILSDEYITVNYDDVVCLDKTLNR